MNHKTRHSDQRHQRPRSPRHSEFGRHDQHHSRPHPKRAKSNNNWNQDHTSSSAKNSKSHSPNSPLALMMEDRSTDLRSYLRAKTSVSQKITNFFIQDQTKEHHVSDLSDVSDVNELSDVSDLSDEVTNCDESRNSCKSLLQQKLKEIAELRLENERLRIRNRKSSLKVES